MDLKKLTTVRLVAFLKAERGRHMQFERYCQSWDNEPSRQDEAELAKSKAMLEAIKAELKTRGHILRGREGRAIRQQQKQGSDPMSQLRTLQRDLYAQGTGPCEDMRKFSELISRSQSILDLSDRDLGDMFQVSPSTLRRWANGTAKPHVRVRMVILRDLWAAAERKIGRFR